MAIDVMLPIRLNDIHASLPVGLRQLTQLTLTSPPLVDQRFSIGPPSIVWQVAPTDTQDTSNPNESLSNLYAQLKVLQNKIEHQKRRKMAKERQNKKELLRKRLVEMEAQVKLVRSELMELSGDEHEAMVDID
jgi:hypothetical protein